MITDQRKIRWRRLRGYGGKLVPLLFAPLGEGVLLALVVQLVRVRVRVRVRGRGRVTVRVRVRELTLTLTLALTP